MDAAPGAERLLYECLEDFLQVGADRKALCERIAAAAARAACGDALVSLELDASHQHRSVSGSFEDVAPSVLEAWLSRAASREALNSLETFGDVQGLTLIAVRSSSGAKTAGAVVSRGAPERRSLVQTVVAAAELALEQSSVLATAARESEERRRMAERLRVLTQASRDFSASSTDYRTLLDVVARTVAGILGEVCSIRLLSPDGQWLRAEDASVFHPDPQMAAEFRRVMLERPQRLGEGLAGKVVSSGEPLVRSVSDLKLLAQQILPEHRPLLEKVDSTHILIVPLVSQRGRLGALTLSRGRQRPAYDADDLRLAQDLADRAALAVENALLLRDLQRQVADNKKAEERFRELLESAPDAIVIVDGDGHIVLVNAQAESLFGYTRAELLGQSVERLVPAAARQRHPAMRAHYFGAPRLRHAMAAGLDLYGLRKDGTEFAAEINLSPITTPEGRLVTAVIRDVTERKRLAEARARALELETENRRVAEASRLKSEFLANMSHELRTPLNAIIGFSSLLHAGKAGPLSDPQVEYLGDILTSSRHLLQLINDVLDLAKIETGQVHVHREAVELGAVARSVRDILRGLATDKRVTLSIEVDPTLGEVRSDARLLKQILYNYVSNAIKFTEAGGSVTLRVEPAEAEHFALRVTDTGIGIKQEFLPLLFRDFQQLDSGSNKRYGGTGLGLALTKRIAQALGGRVEVESEYGRGSTFSAVLPRGSEA